MQIRRQKTVITVISLNDLYEFFFSGNARIQDFNDNFGTLGINDYIY